MRRHLHGLCVALSLCTLIAAPPGEMRPATPDRVALANAEAAWQRVLTNHVDAEGRLNFDAIAAQRADLDTFVGFIWQASPHSHPDLWPTRERALGFWIDAYNALSLYAVIENGIPLDLDSLGKRIGFFIRQHIIIGGEQMSLRALENDIIRPLGEPRIHFALNCMSRSCPRLPQTPFGDADIAATLQHETRLFLAEERNLKVDHKAKTVTVSEIFDFFPEDFEASGGIVAFINQYAEPAVPADYTLQYHAYDWTINRQP